LICIEKDRHPPDRGGSLGDVGEKSAQPHRSPWSSLVCQDNRRRVRGVGRGEQTRSGRDRQTQKAGDLGSQLLNVRTLVVGHWTIVSLQNTDRNRGIPRPSFAVVNPSYLTTPKKRTTASLLHFVGANPTPSPIRYQPSLCGEGRDGKGSEAGKRILIPDGFQLQHPKGGSRTAKLVRIRTNTPCAIPVLSSTAGLAP